jgi:hypothetical protein
MGVTYGLDAKLYRGAAGSTAATEVKNIRDLTYNEEWNEEDVSTRGSAWELTGVTLKKLSIDWEMVGRDDDVDLNAIRDAFVAKTPLAFKVIDKANGDGIDADFLVTKCARKQALKGAIFYDVSIKPTYVTRYPARVSQV